MNVGGLEQRAEKRDLLRSLLRFVAWAAMSYYVVVAGGFAHATWNSVLSLVGIVATMVSAVLSWTAVRGWPMIIVWTTMVLAGGLMTIQTGTPGWMLFGVGTANLLGLAAINVRIAGLIVGVGGIPIVVDSWMEGGGVESVLLTAASVIGVGVVGYSRRLMRARRAQDAALVERSRQLEQRSLEVIEQTEKAHAEAARVAALEERARIARDLHDVLAHSLGGLVVQLDAADAVLAAGGDTEQVATRLRNSRRLAVEGLQEARAAVRELREDGQLSGRSGSGEPDSTAPDPGSGDVADAVLTVVRGPVGMHLGFEFDVVGDQHPVPAPVAAAFAAVAREALTNINKHAGGGRSAGSLIFADGGVRLEMINSVPDQADHDPSSLADTGGGYGLSGMERRMADIGGTLSAARDGDRWVVSAAWPTDDRADVLSSGSVEVE